MILGRKFALLGLAVLSACFMFKRLALMLNGPSQPPVRAPPALSSAFKHDLSPTRATPAAPPAAPPVAPPAAPLATPAPPPEHPWPTRPLLVERPFQDADSGERVTCYRALSVADATGNFRTAKFDPGATPLDGWRRSPDPTFDLPAPGRGLDARGPGPQIPGANCQTPLPEALTKPSAANGNSGPTRTKPPAVNASAAAGLEAGDSPIVSAGAAPARTLVIYIFSNTDPNYFNNLVAFVNMGVAASDRVEFVIVLNLDEAAPTLQDLPCLPPNARYLVHKNECLDFGTLGWLMNTGRVHVDRYRFVVVLNSSVRGPYVPRYAELLASRAGPAAQWHWTDAFTSLLDERVKLSGTTASCERMMQYRDEDTPEGVHIQSQVFAIDSATLKQLRASDSLFRCYDVYSDTVKYSEIGISRSVLELGWYVQALMLPYADVDWFDSKFFQCNSRVNPSELGYRGVEMNPYELVFIKYKQRLIDRFQFVRWMADDWARRQAEVTPRRLVPVEDTTGLPLPPTPPAAAVSAEGTAGQRQRSSVLIVYSHLQYQSNKPDRLTVSNFKFFVKQSAEYFYDYDTTFVVLFSLARGTKPEFKRSPELSNVKIMYRHVKCKKHEDNPLLWTLKNVAMTYRQHFNNFVFVDSRMRGPHVPLYALPKFQPPGAPDAAGSGQRWMDLFTRALRDDTLMVGATIKCSKVSVKQQQQLLLRAPRTGAGRLLAGKAQLPAVQTSAFAFSDRALDVWDKHGLLGNWTCGKGTSSGKFEMWESALSLAVLEDGFKINSLMNAYSHVNWRDPAAWGCNDLRDPTVDGFRGFDVNPLEVMFSRVEEPLVHKKSVQWALLFDSLKFNG